MSDDPATATTDPVVDDGDGPLVYPQPTPLAGGGASEGEGPKPYRYLRYETAERTFFPANDGGGNLAPDTLVWVLLSKGKNKVPKLHRRARVCDGVADGDGRILVRYPNQSTYRVRRKHLVPVPEHQTHAIVVASETNDYRRMSIVHTRKEDHFIGAYHRVAVSGCTKADKTPANPTEPPKSRCNVPVGQVSLPGLQCDCHHCHCVLLNLLIARSFIFLAVL